MKYRTGHPLPGEPAIKVRDVDLYGLGEEYFEAYCHYRGEIRTFRISRVLWVSPSSQSYLVPDTYAPNTWVTEGWGELAESEQE